MKKILASSSFIIAFTAYAIFQHSNTPVLVDSKAPISTNSTDILADTTPTSPIAPITPPQPTVSTPVVQPKPIIARGPYRDGAYTGTSVDAIYGYVQVRVSIANGKISKVIFLDYPQDRGTSRQINAFAIPRLTQEALVAQSSRVNGVSGASDTSAAFKESLAFALKQAA